jgi:hypothetical protein
MRDFLVRPSVAITVIITIITINLILSATTITITITKKNYNESSVGIKICYWPDDPRIESRWVRVVLHMFRRALGSTQPPL